MKIRPTFRVSFPPVSKESINRCEKGLTISDSDKTQMASGFISEEQLADNAIYPCPFCGERNFRSYYEKKFYNMQKDHKKIKINDMEQSSYNRGLVIEEHVSNKKGKLFSRETWYYKDVMCTTCNSAYQSGLYRKQKYVKIPSK